MRASPQKPIYRACGRWARRCPQPRSVLRLITSSYSVGAFADADASSMLVACVCSGISPLGCQQKRFMMTRMFFIAIVTALLSVPGYANEASTGRGDAIQNCNVAAQKRWSGKYDYERNQRAVYAACMFSHGQPQ
jgi:hypothetical protein